MKYVIIGRTATGKTYIANRLAEAGGLSILKTTTTRPQRNADDTTCHFITAADAAKIPAEQKLLATTQNGHEYFTNMDDLMAADICILDPSGFKELITLLPGESIQVVYAVSTDSVIQKQMAVDRAADPIAEALIFNQRQVNEDAMFSQWEKDLATKTTFGLTTFAMHRFENNYTPESADGLLKYLVQFHTLFNHMLSIAEQCIDIGILDSNAPGFVNVTFSEPSARVESMPVEHFVDIALASDSNTAELVKSWLTLDMELPVPDDVVLAQLGEIDDDDDDANIFVTKCDEPIAEPEPEPDTAGDAKTAKPETDPAIGD